MPLIEKDGKYVIVRGFRQKLDDWIIEARISGDIARQSELAYLNVLDQIELSDLSKEVRYLEIQDKSLREVLMTLNRRGDLYFPDESMYQFNFGSFFMARKWIELHPELAEEASLIVKQGIDAPLGAHSGFLNEIVCDAEFPTSQKADIPSWRLH